jgi:hypothetical protein
MNSTATTGSSLRRAAATGLLLLALAQAGCGDPEAAWRDASRKTTVSGTVAVHMQQIGDDIFEGVKFHEHVRLTSGDASYALFIPVNAEIVGLTAAEQSGPMLRDYFIDHPATVCTVIGCLINAETGLPEGVEPATLPGLGEAARAEAEYLKTYCLALQRFHDNREFLFPPLRRGPEAGSVRTEGAVAMDEKPVRVLRATRIEIPFAQPTTAAPPPP